MNTRQYREQQKWRRIEAAIRKDANSGCQVGGGYKIPIECQICVIARQAIPAMPDTVVINGRTMGSPALVKGQVHRYDFFGGGSVVTWRNDDVQLAINIGMGRYWPIDCGELEPDFILDTTDDPLRDQNNSELSA